MQELSKSRKSTIDANSETWGLCKIANPKPTTANHNTGRFMCRVAVYFHTTEWMPTNINVRKK